jgi:RNA polymerase primary sigma factor
MYYGLNFSKQFTLEEIGNELKLTRERVRLIRDRSLRKLFRNPLSRAKLTSFIGDLK